MEKAPIIEARGLSKSYGRLTAVAGLDLSIRAGQIFGLLGPNGSGKTSTILMLLGLSRPTAGSVSVMGLDPLENPLEVKRRIGYLPENVGFYNDLSARQNLSFVYELNRLAPEAREEAIEEALSAVGISQAADRRAGALSRGMRQRLGLAELLIKRAEIFILDEPTLGLDPEGIDWMLEFLADLSARAGLTVLLSSHLLDLVERVVDRVAILNGGRLMAHGQVAELAAAASLEPGLRSVYRHYFRPGEAES